MSTAGSRRLTRDFPGQLERSCGTCGITIYVYRSAVREVMFCSHACCAEWKRTRRGPKAGGWRGGIAYGDRVKVYAPDHPQANGVGYVYRYRLVAEQMLGRYLTPEEVVHHKDEDRRNDDPNNLEIFPNEAEHQRYHGRKRGGLNGASK